MAKKSGLGQYLILGDTDISGDVGTIDNASMSRGTHEVTGINKRAKERLLLKSDSSLEFSGFFNPTGMHPEVAALPRTDIVMSYLDGDTVGAEAATMVAKQVNYDPSLGGEGALELKVSCVASDGSPLGWGKQLTAGVDTFTVAAGESTSSLDFGAASTGGFFTVHCTAFTGTTCTVRLQDSPDNSTFADVDASASTVFVSTGAARISLSPSVNIDRYVRGRITGTFTTVDLLISFVKG